MCKVSSTSVHRFRRSCTYEKYEQGDSYILPKTIVCGEG